MTSLGILHACQKCHHVFTSKRACIQHMNDYSHWVNAYRCETCTQVFLSQRSCDKHMNQMDHHAPQYACETCNLRFNSQEACDMHMTQGGHWATRYGCETCEKFFSTVAACDRHMDEYEHWRRSIPCETCDEQFSSPDEARKHMDELHHWSEHYCAQCDRTFRNEEALRKHFDSSIHIGSGITCPFCKEGFRSAVGVSAHLECGACPRANSLGRDVIYRYLHDRDTKGMYTNNLMDPLAMSDNIMCSSEFTWNGYGYECFLCHRVYRKLGQLDNHLRSDVHAQNLYHCPNKKCRTDFSSLESLLRHLESQACGVVRFEQVQKGVAGFLSRGRRLLAHAQA